MAWDFATDPEFEKELMWVDEFVRQEVEPIDLLITSPYDLTDPIRQALIPPLQAEVKARGLWACHLGPELGGPGMGQLRLALLNEILGRTKCGPSVFGCQAPDTGNAEILAAFGTPGQKERFLEPLLANEIVSAFSMTEPQGGADPKVFTTRAVLDGDDWVISGEKWFSSNARWADFLIVMVVTEPDAPPYERLSALLVPTATPGVEIVRNIALHGEHPDHGGHAYVRYHDARVPADHLLGGRGQGFVVAQTRLGGGRIHHAMRAVGLMKRALDAMCERAVSRFTQGEPLGHKQLVQEMIADSWLDLETFRLLVLRTAWKIDQLQDYRAVRADISAVKALMPRVLHDVSARALQIHGSLGVSNEMPFAELIVESFHMGLADGPTEVHKVTVAKELLKNATPSPGLFPTTHLPARLAAAREKHAATLAALEGP